MRLHGYGLRLRRIGRKPPAPYRIVFDQWARSYRSTTRISAARSELDRLPPPFPISFVISGVGRMSGSSLKAFSLALAAILSSSAVHLAATYYFRYGSAVIGETSQCSDPLAA